MNWAPSYDEENGSCGTDLTMHCPLILIISNRVNRVIWVRPRGIGFRLRSVECRKPNNIPLYKHDIVHYGLEFPGFTGK